MIAVGRKDISTELHLEIHKRYSVFMEFIRLDKSSEQKCSVVSMFGKGYLSISVKIHDDYSCRLIFYIMMVT